MIHSQNAFPKRLKRSSLPVKMLIQTKPTPWFYNVNVKLGQQSGVLRSMTNDSCIQVRLVGNRDTNESKGFAFVGFRRKNVAQKAIIELHNKDFKGEELERSFLAGDVGTRSGQLQI
ncbi:putative RNA recognition motif domain, nucleotide-binding alpha-beta plait domain superfamily [Helianthus anomalus]